MVVKTNFMHNRTFLFFLVGTERCPAMNIHQPRFSSSLTDTRLLKRMQSEHDLTRSIWSPVHVIEQHTIINAPLRSRHPLSPFYFPEWRSNASTFILRDWQEELRDNRYSHSNDLSHACSAFLSREPIVTSSTARPTASPIAQ